MGLAEREADLAIADPSYAALEDEDALRAPLRVRLTRRTPQALSVAWIVLVLAVLYGPLLMLAAFSFNDSTVISLPWAGFTMKWYTAAYESGNLRSALVNSVLRL